MPVRYGTGAAGWDRPGCGCDFVDAPLGRSWSIPRSKGGGKMSLRHRSHPVNRTSPVRLRGWLHPPSRDRPVELDARRLARPVRRRLVGVILHPTIGCPRMADAGPVGESRHSIRCTLSGLAADWGRCGQTFDVHHRRPSWFKAGEAHTAERNPAQGARGHRPRSTWLAWGVSCLATGRSGRDWSGDWRKIRWPRKAQPRKARKGLPVNLSGDGAELRMTLADG